MGGLFRTARQCQAEAAQMAERIARGCGEDGGRNKIQASRVQQCVRGADGLYHVEVQVLFQTYHGESYAVAVSYDLKIERRRWVLMRAYEPKRLQPQEFGIAQ